MPRATVAERFNERKPRFMQADGSIDYISAQAWAKAAGGIVIDECDKALLYQFDDGSMLQIGPAGMSLYEAR